MDEQDAAFEVSGVAMALYLVRETDKGAHAPWKVQRIEIITPDHVDRRSYKEARPLRAVLIPEAVDKVTHAVSQNSTSAVISKRDEIWQFPGLILGGLRIILVQMKNGLQSAIVRFSKVLGQVDALVIDRGPGLGPVDTIEASRSEVSLRVLIDLLHPCLQLADVDPPERGSPEEHWVEQRMRQLALSKQELSFYELLLWRYMRREIDPNCLPPLPHRLGPAT